MKKTRGQVLVEFALVIPVLLTILVGIIEVARLTGNLVVLRHGAYDLVRMASVGLADGEVATRGVDHASLVVPDAATYISSWYETDAATGQQVFKVRYSDDGDQEWVEMHLRPIAGARKQGDAVWVTYVYGYRPLYLGWVFESTASFYLKATGRVEYPPS